MPKAEMKSGRAGQLFLAPWVIQLATALIAGPKCQAGESLISVHQNEGEYNSYTTSFTVLPPNDTPLGVTAMPRHQVEDAESSAVATIIDVRGSVPREVGAKMIIHPLGQHVGTVGGGLPGELQQFAAALDRAGRRGSRLDCTLRLVKQNGGGRQPAAKRLSQGAGQENENAGVAAA